jgi:hypothetical protein
MTGLHDWSEELGASALGCGSCGIGHVHCCTGTCTIICMCCERSAVTVVFVILLCNVLQASQKPGHSALYTQHAAFLVLQLGVVVIQLQSHAREV